MSHDANDCAVPCISHVVADVVAGGGSPVAEYPAVLDSFLVWLDTDSIKEANGVLTDWVNKGTLSTAADHNVIGGAPNVTTLNAKLCVEFAQEGDFAETISISNIPQPFTVVSVVKNDVVLGDFHYHWDKNTNYVDTRVYTQFDGGQVEGWDMWASKNLTINRDATDKYGTYGVQSFFNGASSEINVSSVGIITGDAGTLAANYGRVGGRSDGQKTLLGRMGFHGIIDRALTAQEQADLHAWLANRWGFTWS